MIGFHAYKRRYRLCFATWLTWQARVQKHGKAVNIDDWLPIITRLTPWSLEKQLSSVSGNLQSVLR